MILFLHALPPTHHLQIHTLVRPLLPAAPLGILRALATRALAAHTLSPACSPGLAPSASRPVVSRDTATRLLALLALARGEWDRASACASALHAAAASRPSLTRRTALAHILALVSRVCEAARAPPALPAAFTDLTALVTALRAALPAALSELAQPRRAPGLPVVEPVAVARLLPQLDQLEALAQQLVSTPLPLESPVPARLPPLFHHAVAVLDAILDALLARTHTRTGCACVSPDTACKHCLSSRLTSLRLRLVALSTLATLQLAHAASTELFLQHTYPQLCHQVHTGTPPLLPPAVLFTALPLQLAVAATVAPAPSAAAHAESEAVPPIAHASATSRLAAAMQSPLFAVPLQHAQDAPDAHAPSEPPARRKTDTYKKKHKKAVSPIDKTRSSRGKAAAVPAVDPAVFLSVVGADVPLVQLAASLAAAPHTHTAHALAAHLAHCIDAHMQTPQHTPPCTVGAVPSAPVDVRSALAPAHARIHCPAAAPALAGQALHALLPALRARRSQGHLHAEHALAGDLAHSHSCTAHIQAYYTARNPMFAAVAAPGTVMQGLHRALAASAPAAAAWVLRHTAAVAAGHSPPSPAPLAAHIHRNMALALLPHCAALALATHTHTRIHTLLAALAGSPHAQHTVVACAVHGDPDTLSLAIILANTPPTVHLVAVPAHAASRLHARLVGLRQDMAAVLVDRPHAASACPEPLPEPLLAPLLEQWTALAHDIHALIRRNHDTRHKDESCAPPLSMAGLHALEQVLGGKHAVFTQNEALWTILNAAL